MRLAADVWLIWTVAAVALVTAKYAQGCWYSRQIAKREMREANERGYQQLLDDLIVGNPPGPRVQAWLFPTPQGNELRWKVRASCEAEAAEILSQSFKPEAA